MKKTLWLKVTPDKYELPVAVADDPHELARMVGCKVNNIYSALSNVEAGRSKRSIYVRVEV